MLWRPNVSPKRRPKELQEQLREQLVASLRRQTTLIAAIVAERERLLAEKGALTSPQEEPKHD